MSKDNGQQVIAGTLHRVRRAREQRFVEAPPSLPPAREPVRRPARVAIALALAHKIEQAIERGVVADRADVARRLGLTRARVTQLLDLTLLAPRLQAAVLDLKSIDGAEPASERGLRAIAHVAAWTEQLALWNFSSGSGALSVQCALPSREE
ncbi:MAG: hypothetical protein QM765_19955 [Myxococcales bacterium]